MIIEIVMILIISGQILLLLNKAKYANYMFLIANIIYVSVFIFEFKNLFCLYSYLILISLGISGVIRNFKRKIEEGVIRK